MIRKRSVTSHSATLERMASSKHDGQGKVGERPTDEKIPQLVHRRTVPGCGKRGAMCWGIHAGREWTVVGSSSGRLSVLCNGSAGASNHRKSPSLWQLIEIKAHMTSSGSEGDGGAFNVGPYDLKRQNSPDSRDHTAGLVETGLLGVFPGRRASAEDSPKHSHSGDQTDSSAANTRTADESCAPDNDGWGVTALAWCKPPSRATGSHPLDPDALYCASFAAATNNGRICIFYPGSSNVFEWELISVLRPEGSIRSLAWAPDGHHLVSGGSHITLWSPDVHSGGGGPPPHSVGGLGHSVGGASASAANSITGSVGSSPSLQRRVMLGAPRGASLASGPAGSLGYDLHPDANTVYEDEKVAIFDASWSLDNGNHGDGSSSSTAHTVMVDFSSDGRMFATLDEHSIEVRVWFEGESLYGNLDYLSLFHPNSVVSLEWRLRGSSSNLHVQSHNSHTPQSMVTLCRDNKVRVWQESDPQTEEFNMFVATSIDVSQYGGGGGLARVGWLRFVNYFEGLRSPFPEHSSYCLEREDFVTGFNRGSPFFHASSHYAAVWGQHQRSSAELRTGPIAQEQRSSLDWIVGVTVTGKTCMWSIEGLSDSPRRDIHCLPWSRSTRTIFKQDKNWATASPYILRRAEDIYHSRYRSPSELLYETNPGGLGSMRGLKSFCKKIGVESGQITTAVPVEGGAEVRKEKAAGDFRTEEKEEGESTKETQPALDVAFATCPLVATCRITQEFDPHIERDPWPSTCVYDINPKNIEVLTMATAGLTYSFEEVDLETHNDHSTGLQMKREVCLARGHAAPIERMTFETVVDTSRRYSVVEESYWVTSLDSDGVAIAWPVRSGEACEEVDADALFQGGAMDLPRRKATQLACCSEIAHGLPVAAILSQGSLEIWQSGLDKHRDAWRLDLVLKSGLQDCRGLFVIRNAEYSLVVGISHDDGDSLSLFRVEQKGQSIASSLLATHASLGAACVCGVSDKRLLRHGVFAIAATHGGQCLLLGSEQNPSSVGKFSLGAGERSGDEVTVSSISNSSSGKIITVHKAVDGSFVKIWTCGLCHLHFSLETTIDPSKAIGSCDVVEAHALHLGSRVDVIGLGVVQNDLQIDQQQEQPSAMPKVLVYSAASSKSQYELLCSTHGALSGGDTLAGLAWSGRDFGLAVATDRDVHLFKGWLRHARCTKLGKELAKLRKLSELSHKRVGESTTMQLDAVNSLGDAAVGLQLPIDFHRPKAVIEMLRAGWAEPARHVLRELLKCLQERRDDLADMYDDDESPPARAMVVTPPTISLNALLNKLSSADDAQKAGGATGSQSQEGDEKKDELEEPKKETAAGLFDDDYDDFSFGGGGGARRGGAADLFSEDPWDAILSKQPEAEAKKPSGTDAGSPSSELSELLVSYRVEGLDSSEQLQMSAIAGIFDQVYGIQSDRSGVSNGMDEAGARFVLLNEAFRVFSRCLLPSDRPTAMTTAEITWAYESDSQDALLARCLPALKSTWDDAKRIGVGLWLKSSLACKTLAEQLAKSQYSKSAKNPFSCALFYFSLGKASVVSNLFRLEKNVKAAELLANDFSEERWKAAAVKNAFSLLRQRKFEEAASFMVLGGKLAEATNICVKSLGDYQLAIFLCKVIEGDWGPIQAGLWRNTILPLAETNSDPWLLSMCNAAAGNAEQALVAFIKNRDSFLRDDDDALVHQVLDGQPGADNGKEHKVFDGNGGQDEKDKARATPPVLEKLGSSFPCLSTSFDPLEPVYIRYMLGNARRANDLERAQRTGVARRVLQESSLRAVIHFASIGIPLLSLHELESIDAAQMCALCSEQWRVQLAAQAFHPFIVRAHTCVAQDDENSQEQEAKAKNHEGETEEKRENADHALAENQSKMICSDKTLARLSEDLQSTLDQVAHCSRSDVLESLLKISRASNHVAIELSLERMHNVGQELILNRIGTVLNSVMTALVALGQDRIELGTSCYRRLLPARRLGAYATLLLDLAASPDVTLRAGTTTEGRLQFKLLFETFACVALVCAAYLTGDKALMKLVLNPRLRMSSMRPAAHRLALDTFDYEELLRFESDEKASQSSHFGSTSSFSGCQDSEDGYGFFGESEGVAHPGEGEDEDLSGWGHGYAGKLLDVMCARSLLHILMSKRDDIVHIGTSMHRVNSKSSGQDGRSRPSSPRRRASMASLATPDTLESTLANQREFCIMYIEEVVQAAWPLNWTFLSDLHVFRVPAGMSDIGAARLEAMKAGVFSDDEKKRELWRSLRGKEQLRIIDATAKWTDRSLDQERAHIGRVPSPAVFCAANVKVVYTQPGSLLLSVDSVGSSKEGTIVVASDKGTEVVRFSFGGEDLDIEGGSEDEDAGSSLGANLLPVAAQGGGAADDIDLFSTRSLESGPGTHAQDDSMLALNPRKRQMSISAAKLESLDLLAATRQEEEEQAEAAAAAAAAAAVKSKGKGKGKGKDGRTSPKLFSSFKGDESKGLVSSLSRPRKALKIRRRNKLRRAQSSEEHGEHFVTSQHFSHAWSNHARTLLMVSKSTENLWWGEALRMPLNGNLFADSFTHSVSFHQRLERMLHHTSSEEALVGDENKVSSERLSNPILDLYQPSPKESGKRPSSPPPQSPSASLLAKTPAPSSSAKKHSSLSKTQRALLARVGLGGHSKNKSEGGATGSVGNGSGAFSSGAHRDDASVKPVMHVQAHPFLPYYATANFDGSCSLTDISTRKVVTHFKRPASSSTKAGHATRVRFAENGLVMAGCDSGGQALIWNLSDSCDGESEPFAELHCHSKRALDLAFLNYNGSIFASVGQSQHSENLCLWDLSLPPRSCRIAKVHCCANTAAYSVAHLQDEQVLLVGGGNGQLSVFDLRQRVLLMEEEHVHQKAIRGLAVHPSKGNYFGTGSTDGTVKLWTYKHGRPTAHAHLTNMHPTHTMWKGTTSDSLISQRGTTDLAFSRDFLLTCGADGNVKITPLSSLML